MILLLGLILLIIVFVQGANAMEAMQTLYEQFFGEDADQPRSTLFWSASGSYIVTSLVCCVVGAVGIHTGMNVEKKKGAVSIPSVPTPKVSNASQIRCGSCGTMNDLDALFCKNCGKISTKYCKTITQQRIKD